MANYESENFFDGDWDDKGDIAWNEFDWARYLQRCDAETAKFREVYRHLIDRPDRLDEAARKMGWDRDDWSASMEEEIDETPNAEGFSIPDFSEFSNDLRPENASSEEGDPYSAQRHPVYVVTRALALDIEMFYMRLISQPELRISAALAWDSATSLRDVEMHVGMAVNSLDLGDFALAICYLKRCFTNLNKLLADISRLSEFLPPRLSEPFTEKVNTRLFDLREIWLRVISECREESNQNFGEDSQDEESGE